MKLDIEAFLESIPPDDVEMKHILALKYVERKRMRKLAMSLDFPAEPSVIRSIDF